MAERRPSGGAWTLDGPDGLTVDNAGADAFSSGLEYAKELPEDGLSFPPDTVMAPRLEASPDVSVSPSKLSEGRKLPEADPVDDEESFRLW